MSEFLNEEILEASQELDNINDEQLASKGFSISKAEQEVHINFCADDKNAQLYTTYHVWLKRCDKLVKQFPDVYKVVNEEYLNGEIFSKTYEFPIKYLKLFKPRNISEEKKEELRQRLSGMRERSKNNGATE